MMGKIVLMFAVLFLFSTGSFAGSYPFVYVHKIRPAGSTADVGSILGAGTYSSRIQSWTETEEILKYAMEPIIGDTSLPYTWDSSEIRASYDSPLDGVVYAAYSSITISEPDHPSWHVYLYLDGAVDPTADSDGDGVYDVDDMDSDGDGIPDTLPAADGNARVYVTTDGGATLAESSTVFDVSGTPKSVEVWPSRTALAAAKITEHSRNVTWHCILFDNTGTPLRDHAGRAVNFLVAPEWRKQSELYEVSP